MKQEDYIKLIDDFGNAAMAAATSNDGSCVDVTAGAKWERMKGLRKRLREVESIES